MVVSNYYINAVRFRLGYFFYRSNTKVNGDNKPRSRGSKLLDSFQIKSITLAVPFGDINPHTRIFGVGVNFDRHTEQFE